MSNPPLIPKPTVLQPDKEKAYREWINSLPPNHRNAVDENYNSDVYDYRRMFFEQGAVSAENGEHFTDRYKYPSHPTFSNESIYFTPTNQYRAGSWNETPTSWDYKPYNSSFKDSFSESKNNLQPNNPTTMSSVYNPNLYNTLYNSTSGLVNATTPQYSTTYPNVSYADHYSTGQMQPMGNPGAVDSTGNPLGGIMGAVGAMSPLGLGTLGLGVVNTAVGLYGLSKMGKSPNYSVSGELSNSYNRAENMSNYGLTPEEYSNAQGGITRSNNTAYRNAVDMSGGNLSGALRGAIGAQNLDANMNLAAMDAAQRRQNIQYADGLGMQVQAQKNLMTAQDIEQYNRKQAAYGQAAQSGLGNLGNFTNLASLGKSGLGYMYNYPNQNNPAIIR